LVLVGRINLPIDRLPRDIYRGKHTTFHCAASFTALRDEQDLTTAA
jgi:hypothetical protein